MHEPVDFGRTLNRSLGNFNLAIRGAGHGLFGVFVDGADNQGGPVFLGELAELVEAFFAVFEVGRVDDALAAGCFEPGFDGDWRSGIEHQRGVCLAVPGGTPPRACPLATVRAPPHRH